MNVASGLVNDGPLREARTQRRRVGTDMNCICPRFLGSARGLDRLLENDPDDRFQDGAEFMRAIRPLINFSGGVSRGKA